MEDNRMSQIRFDNYLSIAQIIPSALKRRPNFFRSTRTANNQRTTKCRQWTWIQSENGVCPFTHPSRSIFKIADWESNSTFGIFFQGIWKLIRKLFYWRDIFLNTNKSSLPFEIYFQGIWKLIIESFSIDDIFFKHEQKLHKRMTTQILKTILEELESKNLQCQILSMLNWKNQNETNFTVIPCKRQ